MLIVGFTSSNSAMLHPAGLLQYMSLTQIYTQGALWRNPVPATWTVCVELSFYAFLPLWAYLMQQLVARVRSGWKAELWALGLLASASAVWKVMVVLAMGVPNDFKPSLVVLPASLDLFAAGMALAVLSVQFGQLEQPRRFAPRIPLAGATWLVAAGLFGVMCWLSAFDGPLSDNWKARSLAVAFLKGPVAVGLILPAVLGIRSGLVARSLGSRAVLWIGVVSYGLYLWHVPVLRATLGFDAGLAHSSYLFLAAGAAVAYLLSLAVAAVSWQLLERPVIDAARGLLGRDRDGSDQRARLGVLIDA